MNAGEKDYHRLFPRKKMCRFCADKNLKIDFRDPNALRFFITDQGKIIPRRIVGNCARHQRRITKAIKRARQLALIPYASSSVG